MTVNDPARLRQFSIFARLDDEEIDALAAQLDTKQYLKGQRLFSIGDEGGSMFLVSSGQIELYMLDNDGEKIVLGASGPGDLFGEMSLIDNQPRSAYAKALEDTEVFVAVQEDLTNLVRAHPDAALDLLAMFSHRLRAADERARERGIRNANAEISQLPTNLGDRLADLLTKAASNIKFTYFSVFWFASWITINLGLIPFIKPFDPYPFGFLTMVVSLEAIFLSLFVLISQDRQSAHDKIRNDIEYDVNVRAELEVRDLVRHMDEMEQAQLQTLAKLNTLETHLSSEIGKTLTRKRETANSTGDYE